MSEPIEQENARRAMTELINGSPMNREQLEVVYPGLVWDTQELQQVFKVLSFAAPYVIVMRKADGVLGTVMFQHHPRFYFGWQEDR